MVATIHEPTNSRFDYYVGTLTECTEWIAVQNRCAESNAQPLPKASIATNKEAKGWRDTNGSRVIEELTAGGSIYSIDCTGDVVVGDEIEFTEAVFGGSYRKPQHLGDRTNRALVVRDSYGAGKQQHTFTLHILASIGHSPLEGGSKTTRKGRNVYRNGTKRRPWIEPALRDGVQDEKHSRGDTARAIRDYRRATEMQYR